MVYLWLLVMPFTQIAASNNRKEIAENPVLLPTFNCMIIATFYCSMINLLEAFKDPFGAHTDAMHVQTIFLESETTILEFLTAPVPTDLQHLCKEELFTGASDGDA